MRKRNEAFFQQNNSNNNSNSLDLLIKKAHQTGSLNLSSFSFTFLPNEIYFIDQIIQNNENFWEIIPLNKLDLSYNIIQNISSNISNLNELIILKLKGNQLINLPKTIFLCKKLKFIDLSCNKINNLNSFEENIDNNNNTNNSNNNSNNNNYNNNSNNNNNNYEICFHDLQEFYVNENNLNNFPEFLLNSYDIKVLELNMNKIRFIPNEICNLRQLNRLCINNNNLQELPNGISILQNLQVFDVRKNRLTSIPDLRNLKQLTLLDVGENLLVEIPNLPENGQLGRVHFDCNQIRVLNMNAISSTSSTLFELHLHGNKISILPQELALFTSLKVLDVSNNDINDIPASIGYIDTLQRFVLDGNPIRAIRRSLITQSTHDLKKYLRTRGPPLEGTNNNNIVDDTEVSVSEKNNRELTRRMRDIEGDELNFSGLKINQLPDSWSSKVQRSNSFEHDETTILVTRINLSKNQFTNFPHDILLVPLPQLRFIDFSENQLGSRNGVSIAVFGEFPITTNHILPPQLKELNLSKNNLTSQDLSAILGCFYHLAPSRDYSLTRLLLSNNLISTIPSNLSNHSMIRELQLSYNRLTSLNGIDFSLFKQLEIFDISNNKITSLGNVYEATSLRTLLLENNELENIPLELCYLSNLQTLSLHGNPQRTVRQAIIQKGVLAILSSLQSKLDPNNLTPSSLSTSTSVSTSTSSSMKSNNNQQTSHTSRSSSSSISQNTTSTTSTVFDRPNRSTARNQITYEPDSNYNTNTNNNNNNNNLKKASVDSISNDSYQETGNNSKILELQDKVVEMEDRLHNDFSLSEASKYALKKEIAKSRANIMRLKRAADETR